MHTRRRTRLLDYDYVSQGWYFVTICARGRRLLFGAVRDDIVVQSAIGLAVGRAWTEIPDLHPGYDIDRFVVMPNHIHAIVVHARADRTALPTVIGLFKSRVSRVSGMAVWQRSYHDRIIRNDQELAAFRQYIAENPLRWALDRENPDRHPPEAGRSETGPYI